MQLLFLATFIICKLSHFLPPFWLAQSEYFKPRIIARGAYFCQQEWRLLKGSAYLRGGVNSRITVFRLTTNLGKPPLIWIFRQQNPDIVMLNFRNLSYEKDAGNEHHFQNGVMQNGVTQNGVTQNGVTQNGVTQNEAINNISNSLHKRNAQISNGTIGEHNPPDQTFLSRDYPHVQEPPFNRLNRCRWRCKITANAIDAWSRVLFPLAYGLFIVAYWIIYSSANTDKNSQWMTGCGNIYVQFWYVHTFKHREWTKELSGNHKDVKWTFPQAFHLTRTRLLIGIFIQFT